MKTSFLIFISFLKRLRWKYYGLGSFFFSLDSTFYGTSYPFLFLIDNFDGLYTSSRFSCISISPYDSLPRPLNLYLSSVAILLCRIIVVGFWSLPPEVVLTRLRSGLFFSVVTMLSVFISSLDPVGIFWFGYSYAYPCLRASSKFYKYGWPRNCVDGVSSCWWLLSRSLESAIADISSPLTASDFLFCELVRTLSRSFITLLFSAAYAFSEFLFWAIWRNF